MEILNTCEHVVFWRVFKPDDTSYALGWKEGTIAPGKVLNYPEGEFGEIKVEIKNGTRNEAPLMVRAGKKFDKDARLVLTKAPDSAQDNWVLEPAKVTTGPGQVMFQKREQIEFKDLRSADRPVTEEVVLSVDRAFSSGRDMQRVHENSTQWTVGAKIGGEVGKNDVKGTAELSAEFQKKISDTLTKNFSEQVTNAWGQKVSSNYEFTPGKIHAIKTTWTLGVQKATASYFGAEVPITVVLEANGKDFQIVSKATVDELPEDLRAEYLKRNA